MDSLDSRTIAMGVKLEAEIEGLQSTNRHQAEDRGQKQPDHNWDENEERKYSGVHR
jgi:PAB1-binding protein PBP1